MFNLFNIDFLDPNYLLDITFIISIGFGICIIISDNPMFSILYLIALFVSIAGYLYYIGLGLMSLLYLLVYVGAIAILFLFILSLLDIKVSELKAKSIKKDIPLIFIVSSCVFFAFAKYYDLSIDSIFINDLVDYKYSDYYHNLINDEGRNIISSILNSNDINTNINSVFINNWYNIHNINELTGIGNLLYTEYAISFLIMGIILLVSIIGAIVVTTTRK